MSYLNLLRLVVGLTIALVIGLAVAATAGAGHATAPDGRPDLAAVTNARRRTVAWRLAGLVVGIAVGVVLWTGPADWLGLGPGLAGSAFALCLLAGVITGEVTGRPPAGATRTVALEVRAARQFLPRLMTWCVVAFGVALSGLLVATSAVASADDLGRAGRSLTIQCGPYLQRGGGPWPGGYYSLPIGFTVLIGLAVAALATRTVVRRPRPQSDELGRLADDQVRHASTRAIVAACGVLVTIPLAGSALFTGATLINVACGPGAATVLGWAALALAALAGLAFCFFAAVIVLPTQRRIDVATAVPGFGAMTPQLTVDTTSPVPPYEQIRSQLAELIRHGVLAAGDRLPPVRQLAADLGLAVGTVARAYRELELADQVNSRRGGGTTVAPTTVESPAHRERTLAGHAAAYVATARRLGADDDELLQAVRRAAHDDA